MNWYAIMLFMMFSPIAWVINGLLLVVFIYANLKFNMAVNLYKRVMFELDPDDPDPAATMAFMHKEVAAFKGSKEFWFCVLTASGLGLILTIGFPLLCTFTSLTTICP